MRQILCDYKILLSNRIFICFTLLTGIAMGAGMAYATSSSFIMQLQFHLSLYRIWLDNCRCGWRVLLENF